MKIPLIILILFGNYIFSDEIDFTHGGWER